MDGRGNKKLLGIDAGKIFFLLSFSMCEFGLVVQATLMNFVKQFFIRKDTMKAVIELELDSK